MNDIIVYTFIIIIGHGYVAALLFGGFSFVFYLTNNSTFHAIKTLVYLMLLTATTIICALPLLRMHGNYNQSDKIQILTIWIINVILIMLFIITRAKIIKRINTKKISNENT